MNILYYRGSSRIRIMLYQNSQINIVLEYWISTSTIIQTKFTRYPYANRYTLGSGPSADSIEYFQDQCLLVQVPKEDLTLLES